MPRRSTACTRSAWTTTSHRKGHTYLTVVVDHERHRVIWAHGGYGGDVFDLFFKALTPDSANPSGSPATGPTGSTRAPAGGARPPNACSTGSTSSLDDRCARRHQEHGPEGRLYRSWQLKELLRTLLKHPLEQARGELRHWVFLASHSRMPEIVELAKRIGGADRTSSGPSSWAIRARGLEAFDNRIKVTIRMAYGFRHVNNLIAWSCSDAMDSTSDYHNPRSNPRKQQKPRKYLRNERHGIGAGSGVSRAGCRGARSARRSPRRLR